MNSNVVEGMLSEFNYFAPKVVQSSIVQEYDEMISAVNAINPDNAAGLNAIDFNILPGVDLYRDLNNSYIQLTLKITQANGADLANNAAIAPVNLMMHSLFSNVSMTLCGKDVTEKDTLYPYRAYLETLLSYSSDVLNTRLVAEGWAKDQPNRMDHITLAAVDGHAAPNSGFVERAKLAQTSPVLTLVGRPHLDLFHQNLDIPGNCPMSIKFTPSPAAFALMEANANTTKFILLDAKLFVHTKKVCPELVLSHKEMLQKVNMHFPLNRVTVSNYGIAAGFQSINIPLNFPAKLPKRVFLGFVTNTASTGTREENPFNFQAFQLKTLSLSVNGVSLPASGLEMNFAARRYNRAYLNTLAALGLDNDNRAIDLTPNDFGGGFAIYGFKIAPGPIDGTVFSTANNVGSLVVHATFTAALAVNVDMIVYAETPAAVEIDKLYTASIV